MSTWKHTLIQILLVTAFGAFLFVSSCYGSDNIATPVALAQKQEHSNDVAARVDAYPANTNETKDEDTKEDIAKDEEVNIEEPADDAQPAPEQTETPAATAPSPEFNICETNGYVDQCWVDVIDSQLDLLPINLRQAFVDSGWHIYCTDMNIDAAYYGGQYGAVMGTTNYEEYRILIEDRNDAVYESAIHEFGHWFDWYNGTTTDSAAFWTIYNNESSAFCNAFNVNFYYDNKEFFAEGFWKYFTDNETLANNCPELYSYINSLVASYF